MNNRIYTAIRLIITILPLLAFLPKSAKAQIVPPQYEYFYEHQALAATWNPPTWLDMPEMVHWMDWGSQAAFNITQTIRYSVETTSTVASYVQSAATNWDAAMPPWVGWQQVTPPTTSHLIIREHPNNPGFDCPGGATGCFIVTSWMQDITDRANRWQTAKIWVNFTPNPDPYSEAAKRATVLHEMGHAVGLHERYAKVLGLIPTCNVNEVSSMDGLQKISGQWQPCDALTAPAAADQARINTFGLWTKQIDPSR